MCVQSPREFYHALIIQYIEVNPAIPLHCSKNINRDLSFRTRTFSLHIEWQIRKAYQSTHACGVIHGDVGAHSVIVTPDGERVWIIDFEAGEILPEQRDEAIRGEMEEVNYMFEDLRTGKHSQYVFESSA